MLMLTGCPLDTTPFTAFDGTMPGPTVGPPGPITLLPTSAESREISSREDTSADASRSFSVVRYSTLVWREASHAFFRWRHFSAAGKISKRYTVNRCMKIRTLSIAFQKISAFLLLSLWFSLFSLGTVVLMLVNCVFLFLFLLFLFFLFFSRVSTPTGADAIHGVRPCTFGLSCRGRRGPCDRRRAARVVRLAFRPPAAIHRHSCCAVGTCLGFLTFREFLVGLR